MHIINGSADTVCLSPSPHYMTTFQPGTAPQKATKEYNSEKDNYINIKIK